MTCPITPEAAISSAEALLLAERWKNLLGKVPRLQPLVAELLARRRRALEDRLGAVAAEVLLHRESMRWLDQFEALPQFAMSAIGTLLAEEPARKLIREPQALHESEGSPERAVGELETLLSDPAFALAFYCLETRVVPQLERAIGPAVEAVPREVWLGLLHASSPQSPLLTADVAVALVLRVRSSGWARLPVAVRHAAMRIAFASAADLRSPQALAPLCAQLPPAWKQTRDTAPGFAATATAAREGLSEAAALCARVVAATRARSGGLVALHDGGAAPASPAELAELGRAARQFSPFPGFARLLELL